MRALWRVRSQKWGTGKRGPGDLGCELAVQSSYEIQQPRPHLAEGAIGTAQLMFVPEGR